MLQQRLTLRHLQLRTMSLTDAIRGCTMRRAFHQQGLSFGGGTNDQVFRARRPRDTGAPAFCAADAPVEKPVIAQTLESFETEAATVREGMEPGGVYGYIKPADKERVDAGLEHMQKLLQDHSGQPELSREDKVALLNAQEEVNAILLQNDNNRLICERAATDRVAHQDDDLPHARRTRGAREARSRSAQQPAGTTADPAPGSITAGPSGARR
jgi:hypothetical protein